MEGENELAAPPPAEGTTPPATQAPAEGEQPKVTEETAAPEGEAEGEGGEDEEEQRRKKPSGAERAKRRLALAAGEIDRLQRELEEARKPQAPTGQGQQQGRPGIDREPTEADFPNDWFAFQHAKTVWDTRQVVREEVNRSRQDRQAELQSEIRAERIEAWEEGKVVARERIPDFDKVVSDARTVPVKPELAEEILASDKAALLQYHLAKNPDKVRELNQMSGRELAREIGRLEARVHLPLPKKATEAKPPPSQVRGAAAPTVNLAKAEMETYVAERKKQGFR